LNLDPKTVYFIYLKRDYPPGEWLQFEIKGQYKSETVKDFTLSIDPEGSGAWHGYTLN
jgi:hypothetical protein